MLMSGSKSEPDHIIYLTMLFFKGNIMENFIENEDKSVRDMKRYRLIFGTCLGLHTLFLIIFEWLHVSVLFFFNIFSVVLYASFFLSMRKHRISTAWLWLTFMEIIIHAVLCNLNLGWGYGFSFYAVMIIPITYYTTYMHEDIRHDVRNSHLLTLFSILALSISCWIGHRFDKLGELPTVYIKIFFCTNLVICLIGLALYSTYFVLEMKLSTKALQDYNEELYFLANYDALTRLRNRHNMAETFYEYESSDSAYCVALGDIDDFKRINDTYSHNCGDEVLVLVSGIIREKVGEQGVVCRWGGEEILILLSCEHASGQKLIEDIRNAVMTQILEYKGKRIGVTMTFGLTSSDEERDVEKMISIADARLYQGKAQGKNQVVCSS